MNCFPVRNVTERNLWLDISPQTALFLNIIMLKVCYIIASAACKHAPSSSRAQYWSVVDLSGSPSFDWRLGILYTCLLKPLVYV